MSQAVFSFNLLRTSNINPKLSVEDKFKINFDYNTTPLAPVGTTVVAHENPSQQGSWSVHGARGWYLYPSPNHYRCFEVYIKNTGKNRIVDTV